MLLVDILGHGGGLVLAHLLGSVAARLTRGVDIIANLEVENIENERSKMQINLPIWRLGYTSGW